MEQCSFFLPVCTIVCGFEPNDSEPRLFWVQPGFIVCLYQFCSEGGAVDHYLVKHCTEKINAGGSPFCVLFLQSSLYDLSDPCIDTQTGCSGCRLDLHLLSFRKNHRDSVICLGFIFSIGSCSCFCISIRHFISPFLTNIITQKTIMNKYKNA